MEATEKQAGCQTESNIIWEAKDLQTFEIKVHNRDTFTEEENYYRYCARLDEDRLCATSYGQNVYIGGWSFIIQETRNPSIVAFVLNGSKSEIIVPENGLCSCCGEKIRGDKIKDEMTWLSTTNSVNSFIEKLSKKCKYESFEDIMPSKDDVIEIFGNIMKDILLDGIPVQASTSTKRAFFNNAFLFIDTSMEDLFYVQVNSTFSERIGFSKDYQADPIKISLASLKELSFSASFGNSLIKLRSSKNGQTCYIHALSECQHKVLSFGIQILIQRKSSAKDFPEKQTDVNLVEQIRKLIFREKKSSNINLPSSPFH